MTSISSKPVLISGAGLAGSLLAIFLAKRGYRVEVFESRSDMRKGRVAGGRSINLAFSPRGIQAVQAAGALEGILEQAVRMPGRMIHGLDGGLHFAPYGKNDEEYINSVSRSGLNKHLLSEAERYGNVRLHFDCNCVDADLERKMLTLERPDGTRFEAEGQLLIGADGAGSGLRQALERSLPGFEARIEWLDHGYKELTIPPGENGAFAMAKHALHIWPRGSYMLIALPNYDGSFTCTLFLPMEGEPSFDWLNTPERVQAFFQEQFPDTLPLLTNLQSEFKNNPVGRLGTLRCAPWTAGDAALLIGDAAHAVVPFYGQGMNASFEDCLVLDNLIERFKGDWKRILPAYQEQRMPNGNAIADLAVENFFEMRDHVANPVFQRKRQIELELERRYPDYHSKYALVTFHPEKPYTYAKSQGNKQDTFLLDYCAELKSSDVPDLEQLYRHLKEL